jgi:chitinase
MLKAGVELAGINIMTMNFGPLHEDQTMLTASIRAAEGTHMRLKGLFQRSGKPLDDAALWQKMGLTPMIGRNDVPDQVFSRDDAEGLSSFAADRGLGRMSMWSLNRDKACQADDPAQSAHAASGNCSGLDQEPGMFARVLGQPFAGTRSAEPGK